MKILGIETSCDETAASVVDGNQILSNVISSQLEVHAPYGGVVPELASRQHLESLVPIVEEALTQAEVQRNELEGIAATCGPGLVGTLLVGLNFAKSYAAALGLPFVGVNHLEGHLHAIFLAEKNPSFPFVALLVSGGHTHLYKAQSLGNYELISRTLDDAAGEAFDKVAKLLGLGYPGGPAIDKLAPEGDPTRYNFPRPMLRKTGFSFSGLKTAVLLEVRKLSRDELNAEKAHLAASFQEAAVEVLVKKSIQATQESNVGQLVVAGGVASNRRLRQELATQASKFGIEVFIPPPILCTDNAAMIAFVGHETLRKNGPSALSLNASAKLPLSRDYS